MVNKLLGSFSQRLDCFYFGQDGTIDTYILLIIVVVLAWWWWSPQPQQSNGEVWGEESNFKDTAQTTEMSLDRSNRREKK